MHRRHIILGMISVLAGLAGCTSEGFTSQTTSENRGSAKTPATTESPESTLAPSIVTDEEAKERALNAEEKYLKDHLSNATCLNDWGTTPTTASKQATVTKRTAEKVFVEVTHPYWFSTNRSEADSSSEAVYTVTADTAERKSGDNILESIPCE
ncbi:hypothetical protein [Haloparvum sp. PAK95]|uniref:hypothetical protein n=1 Tax=Haloparvum sp. PAK95 TaxID=3418962 RepID=UPI003D2F3498